MLSGGRLFLIALAGLAVVSIAFGLGLMQGGSNPHEERYPAYQYSDQKQERSSASPAGNLAVNALNYKTPCDEPKGEAESDLCAQWRAAYAAENSAFWAKWGFWIAVVGSAFLLWQIILTRRAVEDTGHATDAMREANRIAKESHESSARAYVTAGKFRIENVVVGGNPKISWEIENLGQTIAYDVEASIEVFERDVGTPKFTFWLKRDILPGQKWPIHWNRGSEMTQADVVDFMQNRKTVIYAGVIRYRDFTGRRRWSTFKMKFGIQNMKDGSGPMIYCVRGNRSN